MNAILDELTFDAAGLIPAVVQDHITAEVLMVAWMNREAVEQTVATGKTHFYSRSRKKQWMKGESSGHVQHVRSIRTDCDRDVLLVGVEQVGAACHEGYKSCFFKKLQDGHWETVGEREFDPATVYGK